ncbi:ATP-binding protein [Streptomyces sp. WI03-4A]|uniref:ATP-binding protein n=1 Tax=Streptomyces sp. WI03-4A TaxID=3028706 RepID=UPI0029A1BFF4|nr:ATP-binding protein [Streptomyces sp. WI03-4A]MDX2598009.1 ATP-binding protein [Streptomyces sp. WI03-4A]
MGPSHKERDREIASQLRREANQAEPIESELTTNDRVIARVTDGIYRQPGSALRELIANAYDADATWVSVKTDAPNFSRITVEDDGTGMTPEAVIHLLHNIGGSAKRTEEGQELGIASASDPNTSPGGRKLIGKLGIGIFSVSQLTHSFQIITKTAGDPYRTVVLVNLRQFADGPAESDSGEYKAGHYQVWMEPAEDTEAHGTTIVLTAIRPQTRDTLRSEQSWGALSNPLSEGAEAKSRTTIPTYHIGHLDPQGLRLEEDPRNQLEFLSLPWNELDNPQEAFSKMVNSVWSFVRGRTAVKLTEIFDTYLQMLWSLALALPLPYFERSVLDESVADDWAYFYKLANDPRGTAQQLQSDDPDITVRELAGLPPTEADCTDFTILVDGVQLSRPLKYRGLPTTQHALKKPMVFVGSMRQEFKGFDRDVSAGPLEFEAYLFWTPKVAPTEHQGVLVRIHGASGTLFDSTFLNYQVSELTRLRQITCEIFVKEGLEAALNIDRESFNTAHPHTVILTRWLHNALRQLATAQKRQAQQLRAAARSSATRESEDRISSIVESANSLRTDGEGVIPDIRFMGGNQTLRPASDGITQSFDLDRIIEEIPHRPPTPPSRGAVRKLEAITKVLSVYGVLEQLAPKEQENLLGSILGIMEADNLG